MVKSKTVVMQTPFVGAFLNTGKCGVEWLLLLKTGCHILEL